MRRALLYALLAVMVAPPSLGQSPADATGADSTLAQAYRVFFPDGRRATLDDVVAAMGAVEVVFVGEQHDDPVAHHLEAELLARAYARFARGAGARPLALSMEMFERDVQPIIDEYLRRLISTTHFERSSRPPKNYATDYKPLVEFAKTHGVFVLAANAPRRYVNRVSRRGAASLDTLSIWAKAWLPPLPYPGPLPEYAARWHRRLDEMMPPKKETADADAAADDATAPRGGADAEAASPPVHNRDYMLEAQALWDAAMAHNLSQHLRDTPGVLVVHVTGSFHVEGGWGTPAQLDGYRPGTRRLLILIKAVDDVDSFDAERFGDLGDFLILTDRSLPRSFGQ